MKIEWLLPTILPVFPVNFLDDIEALKVNHNVGFFLQFFNETYIFICRRSRGPIR